MKKGSTMKAKQSKPSAEPQKVGAKIENCTVHMEPLVAPEHANAVLAIARAAESVGRALEKAASALDISQAKSYGIYLQNVSADAPGAEK